MEISKKPLQKPKKPELTTHYGYNVAPGNFHPPYVFNEVEKGGFYTFSGKSFPAYVYTKITNPNRLQASLLHPRNPSSTYGRVFTHVESVFTNESYKTILRTRGKFAWREYYASILVERIRLHYLPLLQMAKEFGCEMYLLSSTPIQYREYVDEFLKQHNLLQFGFRGVIFTHSKRTSTERFIMNNYWNYDGERSNTYFIYDSNKYKFRRLRNLFD
jgi:hypothetical protein